MVKKMNRNIFGLLLFVSTLILICACSKNHVTKKVDDDYMDEQYRPQYHYTAQSSIINDPNGLVFYEGEYHLFHQYNLWGAIHWGHAVSKDLVHWKHLPPAIFPDEIGQIWSGSAVIDEKNTSGLQTGSEKVMVALFTYSEPNGTQSQGLAYSNDKGRTWKKHPENPVLPNPGDKDFRDPKIFWHEASGQWFMVLAAGDHVKIYKSPNLIHWTYESEFGKNDGAHGGAWECPDLFPMAVDGDPNNIRWVLSISVVDGSPAGGTGMQYFVGDFVEENGHWAFKNKNDPSEVLWTNYGKDFYAGVTWNGTPDGRRLMIAWSDNWQYRDVLPTYPFIGQFSNVRELELKTLPEGIRINQRPIKELQSLRGKGEVWKNQTIPSGSHLLKGYQGDAYELIAEFEADATTASSFGFRVRKGVNQYTEVGYNKQEGILYIDRTLSGKSTHEQFPGKHAAQMESEKDKIRMHIFVDRSSVEVYGNDGKKVITDLIFPDQNSKEIEWFAKGGTAKLNSLKYYPLDRVWGKTPFNSTNLSGWKILSGQWADTSSGKEGASDGDSFILSSQHGDNFTYQADIKVSRYKDASAGALVFRSDADAEHAYVVNLDAKNDSVTLFKRGDGGGELDKHSMTIDTDKVYTLKTVTEGSNIKVFVNDQLVIETNDSSYTEGYFGLNVWNSMTIFTNVYYTNTRR